LPTDHLNGPGPYINRGSGKSLLKNSTALSMPPQDDFAGSTFRNVVIEDCGGGVHFEGGDIQARGDFTIINTPNPVTIGEKARLLNSDLKFTVKDKKD